MINKSPVNIAAVRITPRPTAHVDDLRKLLEECAPNKHERAIVAISALIGQGIDTSERIMPILHRLGFKAQHAGIVLSGHTGVDPVRHYWRRDDAGTYALLEPVAPPLAA